MRVKLIKDFIENNSIEQQREYNKELIEKLRDLSNLNNRISLYMILLIIVYFFFKDATIKDVDVSFMRIEKFQTVAQFTPVLFSLVLLYFTIINAHRAELIQFSRILIYELYNNTIENKSSIIYEESNTFARLIQPFSVWLETSKWDVNGKATPMDAFLRLPVVTIIFLPITFIIYSMKILYTQYWELPFSRYAFVFTVWITAYIIYNFFRIMRKNLKWAKE